MALQPAVLGTARLNNFRLNYLSAALVRERATRVGIWLSGVRISASVKIGSLQIGDGINDTPNTCTFLFIGATPPKLNQKVSVTLNSDHPLLLFSGTLQTAAVSYIGRPVTVAWACGAIDDTALANRRRPFGAWTAISATTLAIYLVQTYAPDLSTAGIEAGLPTVDVILDGAEGMSGAFSQLANLIGGYFKFEDGVAYLFTALSTDPCDPIDADHPFLNDPPITASQDVSQLRTRVYGKGHAEATIADVNAGETILPIADAVMFNPAGGQAIAITQRLAYTGLDLGGAGGLAGAGVAPSTLLTLQAVGGPGLSTGVYQYAVVWVTAAGRTLPGPLTAVTTGASGSLAAPTLPIGEITQSDSPHVSGLWNVGDTITYAYSWSTSSGDDLLHETALSPSRSVVSQVSFYGDPKGISFYIPHADPDATYIHLWRDINGAGFRKVGTTMAAQAFYQWHIGPDGNATTGETPPVANPFIPAKHQVTISGVPQGPAGTTAREIYRTTVNGTQLKLQQTINNNSSTTALQDPTPDGSLGADAPTSDTSGLVATSGQVNAGSTSIPTAGASFARPAGGWIAVPGSDAVRYTGVSGNTLTGVPASGPGALTNTIRYGANLVALPILTGVTGITAPIPRGTPINLWVTRTDVAGQSDQIVIDDLNDRVLVDGIYEGPIIVDERRGLLSLTALCDATLALFAQPIQTVRYATRDTKTKSGKPVTVNLASPPITADLVIQAVQISEIDIAPGLAPKFEVTASSTRFSLDSLLRKLTKALGV